MKYKINIIIGLILLTLSLSGLPAAAHISEEEALQKSAGEIYDLIMCPLCAGQTIGQSNNETSRQMRDLVIKKLREGETKEEILQYFESRYGERILAKPNKKGFNLVLWIFPFVAVSLAAIVIYFMIRRWSSRKQLSPVAQLDEDHFPEYQERLENELKQFDKGF
ncbi:MAG: cytochrome c-type biogenesis protein CcmH [Desulfobacterales bacterium]|nr:MAG: cytochrome c-type biogenesis protein CcmH [Desulfobacterales bacterium]